MNYKKNRFQTLSLSLTYKVQNAGVCVYSTYTHTHTHDI